MACCLLMSLFVLGLLGQTAAADETARLAEVASRGTKVMPFSLAKTQHQFTKTEAGGVQRIIARDDMDLEQVWLIRSHLEDLANKFSLGDFSGPRFIHGAAMPGLELLSQAKPGQLQIAYYAEAAGARLTYRTTDAQLLKALHAWFDAQVHDHGDDAVDMNCPFHQQHQQQRLISGK